MCGIAGIIQLNGAAAPRPLIEAMVEVQAHRGPDGTGFLVEGPVALGHCRLSIIDLSALGAQPMCNHDGTVWITYNGELYNYVELRAELIELGHRFRTKSDTEVIIKAYEAWGDACLERFNGMFSFAIWDQLNRRVLLARDRFGVKPLYYTHQPGLRLLFASEVKGLLEHPSMQARVSHEGLQQYFLFQNIYTDHTLFKDVHLLPHGCFLVADLAAGTLTERRYWDFDFSHYDDTLDRQSADAELYRLFVQAVQRQLMSEVPLGSYLSGGLDSGSIVAIAATHIPRLKTFTGGFDLASASEMEQLFDERSASELMASTFGTEHYETIMRAGDMEYALPRLVWHLEDLRVGQSYPNFYIARLASKFVKVVLSGGGGDELFAGYPWRYNRAIHSTSPGAYFENYFDYWQRLVPATDHAAFFTPRMRSLMPPDSYGFDVFRAVYAGYPGTMASVEDLVNASLYFEAKTFMQGLFIVDDKLMMAHSIEGRVPFMDNDLVDFAMRVPPHLKLNYGAQTNGKRDEVLLKKRSQSPSSDGKRIVRSALKRLVPDEILRRNKQGFSAPDASWFRRESYDYIDKLLGPDARLYAFLDRKMVRRLLDEHRSGKQNRRLLIWSLLSFEWWCRIFLAGERPGPVL